MSRVKKSGSNSPDTTEPITKIVPGDNFQEKAQPEAEPESELDRLMRERMEREQRNRKSFSPTSPLAATTAADEARWLDEELIDDNPFQPRLQVSRKKLEKLKASINKKGQLQACLVRPHPTRAGRFQMVAGNRRRLAVKGGANAGIKRPKPSQYIGKLLCVVRDLDDQEVLDAAYAENEDREDFTVFDLANYYLTLQKLSPGTIPGRPPSFEELAQTRQLAHTPRTIRRIVEVLRLPLAVQNRLAEINLSEDEEKEVLPNEKHCRALLSLQPAEQVDTGKPPNAKQRQLLDEIEKEKLSGNEALRRAEKLRGVSTGAGSSHSGGSPSGSNSAGSGAGSGTGSGITSSRSTAGTGAASGNSGASSSSGAALTGSQNSDDPLETALGPALSFIAEAATKIAARPFDRSYRVKVEKRLNEIEKQIARVRNALQ